MVKNNKVFALQSIAVAATVLGVSVFSVSEFECLFTEKEEWGFRGNDTNCSSLVKP